MSRLWALSRSAFKGWEAQQDVMALSRLSRLQSEKCPWRSLAFTWAVQSDSSCSLAEASSHQHGLPGLAAAAPE